jgi:hypothetical protein
MASAADRDPDTIRRRCRRPSRKSGTICVDGLEKAFKDDEQKNEKAWR